MAEHLNIALIKLKEVQEITTKSRASIYAGAKTGTFPSPVKVGPRASAWVKSEVLAWAHTQVAASRGGVHHVA